MWPCLIETFVITVSKIVVFDDQKGWFEEIALLGANDMDADEKLILKGLFL